MTLLLSVLLVSVLPNFKVRGPFMKLFDPPKIFIELELTPRKNTMLCEIKLTNIFSTIK